MAQLAPGQRHELHPTKQINVLGKSVSTPSIVVHIATEEEAAAAAAAAAQAAADGGEIPTININAPIGAGGNFAVGEEDDFGGGGRRGRIRWEQKHKGKVKVWYWYYFLNSFF